MYDDGLGLYYEIKDDNCIIVDSDSKCTDVVIPETIGGKKVTAIGKKAFLGRKLLRSVTALSEISEIGEWAFAYCGNLVSVSFQGIPAFKQGVFKGDYGLAEIITASMDSKISRLMAAAVIIMEAEYMLEYSDSAVDEWLNKWDQKLNDMLRTKDEDGYHLYVLCGEEDLHFDYEEYIEYVRERKCGLCFMRLINDIDLSEDNRKTLISYLNSMRKGAECDAAWQYVLKSKGDDISFYDCMMDIGVIDIYNLEDVLEDMGLRHAEMKSYLIKRLKGDEDSGNDFFADFEL